MIRVLFSSVGTMPDESIYETIEVPAVPRQGDTVTFAVDAGPEYTVRHVMWTPKEPDYDAYVVIGP
jgi:hypothetical protein